MRDMFEMCDCIHDKVSKKEAEQQVQEVAKFFGQLGGAPAVAAFTKGN